MSNEEFEKKAEFIIEQQAQFASQIGQLEDLVVRLAKANIDRFAVSDKRVDDMDERIAALINSQSQTEEKSEENRRTPKQNGRTREKLNCSGRLLFS